jgi:AcrB/AcrD/AcrF family
MKKTSSASFRETACRAQFFSSLPRSQSKPASRAAKAEKSVTLHVYEFRDFRTTLVVASVIPLGVVGGVVALLFSGYTLSFTAIIGFVALVGIEIKTSILLVDFTDRLR